MIDIEKLTKEIFERFASEEHEVKAKWEYLGVKRQKMWLRDVILIAERLLIELRKEVKPLPPGNKKYTTSFGLGYAGGQQEERTRFITMLQKYHDELIKEYSEYMEK